MTVTVAVSNIVFMQPVKVGDTICFYTDVTRIGRTSIRLDVEAWVLRPEREVAGGANTHPGRPVI